MRSEEEIRERCLRFEESLERIPMDSPSEEIMNGYLNLLHWVLDDESKSYNAWEELQ